MAYADRDTTPNTPSLIVSAGVNALLIGAIFLAAPDVDPLLPVTPIKLSPLTPDPPIETPREPEKSIEKPAPVPFAPLKPIEKTPPLGEGLIIPPSTGTIDPPLGGFEQAYKPVLPPVPKPVFTTARLHPGHAGALQPQYPPGMIREGREGVVTVRVLVGVDGRVAQITIVSAETPEFAAATEKQALRKWRFIPATRDGVPVQSWREMTVRFEIP